MVAKKKKKKMMMMMKKKSETLGSNPPPKKNKGLVETKDMNATEQGNEKRTLPQKN